MSEQEYCFEQKVRDRLNLAEDLRFGVAKTDYGLVSYLSANQITCLSVAQVGYAPNEQLDLRLLFLGEMGTDAMPLALETPDQLLGCAVSAGRCTFLVKVNALCSSDADIAALALIGQRFDLVLDLRHCKLPLKQEQILAQSSAIILDVEGQFVIVHKPGRKTLKAASPAPVRKTRAPAAKLQPLSESNSLRRLVRRMFGA